MRIFDKTVDYARASKCIIFQHLSCCAVVKLTPQFGATSCSGPISQLDNRSFSQCLGSKSTAVQRHENLFNVCIHHVSFFQDRSVRLNQACWAPPPTPTSTSTAPSTRSPSLHSTSLRRIMRKSVPPHHRQRRRSLLQRSKTARTMSLTRSHRYEHTAFSSLLRNKSIFT